MSNEYRLPTFDKSKIVDKTDKEILENPSFLNTDQPVLWLISHGRAKKQPNFYEYISKKLKLELIDQIPVKINDSGSLANRVGAEIQSKYSFFSYLEKNTLVIATPDPFLIDTMVENVLPFLKEKPKSIRVKICPHNIVRESLVQSNYIPLTELAESNLKKNKPHLSSYGIFNKRAGKFFIISLITFLIIFWIFPSPVFFGIYALINILYFVLNPVKFLITFAGLGKKIIEIDSEKIENLPEQSLPVYTILVPLKNEHSVARKLVRNLKKLDYPKDKLDIKFITEVDDYQTREEIERELDLSNNNTSDSLVFDLIKVPEGSISTKPRSLNFGIQFARGSISVIYDAEDQPEPDQLKKAFLTFLDKKLDTLCVQAKLNYYNSDQNTLTKFFTMEYSFWFDILLPGLQAWKIPIPLGGTSNHFLTESLRRINMWDPHNVTEDADLGWRLSRLGYSTSMVNSYTFEEANSQVWNWIKQRTRWQKGFLMTLLVHIRTPIKMWRELGPWGFCSSVLVFSTNFFLPVFNPFLWIFFLAWYVPLLFGYSIINFPLPYWLEIFGLVNLIFGNGIYMLTHALGLIKIKKYQHLWLVLFLPLYWVLLSVASYRAIWQIFKNPYFWEKTAHGLDK